MSDSVRPHRRQPTRLLRPWDSPGKNTGVGCHFLLQCMKVKSESEVTQSCLTLSNPMDYSLPGSSIHGIFQARVLEWGAIAFSELSPLGSFIFSCLLIFIFHFFCCCKLFSYSMSLVFQLELSMRPQKVVCELSGGSGAGQPASSHTGDFKMTEPGHLPQGFSWLSWFSLDHSFSAMRKYLLPFSLGLIV